VSTSARSEHAARLRLSNTTRQSSVTRQAGRKS